MKLLTEFIYKNYFEDDQNLSYRDLDGEEYQHLFERSPKRKIFKFDLLKTFQRGFSLGSFIGIVMYILRYFAR